MLRRQAGILAFAACALDASAFLLPAGLTLPNDLVNALSALPPHQKHQLVTLPCTECRYDLKDFAHEDPEGELGLQGASSVAVNITVSHDGTRLEVNEEPIYPLGLQIENIFRSPKIFISQVSSSASAEEIEDGKVKAMPLEVTGHGVTIVEETVVSDDGSKLIPIRLSIFELERQPVSLDEITVLLFKNNSGVLSIMHVETLPPPPPRPDDFFVPMPMDEVDDQEDALPPFEHDRHHHDGPPPPDSGRHQECKMLPAALCKLKHMLEAKIHGMRMGGCDGGKDKHGPPHMGKLPGHIKPHFPRPGHGRPHHGPHHGHHHGRPHHMRPHGEHHHGHHPHHGHHFIHAFSRGLAAVLIPTMAGVAVGMGVSILGLVVGRLIGFLWLKLYRGGRRGYASVALDENSADIDEAGKEVFPAEAELEAPPVYEEAPAYEEAVKDAT